MLSVVAQYGVTLALRSPAGKGMSFDELQNAMREINRLEADLTALDGGGPSGLTGDLSTRRGAVHPATPSPGSRVRPYREGPPLRTGAESGASRKMATA